MKKINYNGSSKVIKRLCEIINSIVDAFPTKTSDLTNDGDGTNPFITKVVDDLVNYYLKSETYTQAEVNSLIGAISTLHIEVVQTLPTHDISTNTIYLVPKQTAGTQDVYDEYIYVNNAWEHIGSTEVDLSNYYTSAQVDTLLGGKVDVVAGKGLSTEDYTTAEKTKLSGIATGAEVNVQSDWNQTDNTADDYIKNKPLIPSGQIQSDWSQTDNTQVDFIKNKPSIPAAQVNADWNASSGVAEILNKPTIPAAQIQSDWSQTDNTSADFIKNKPTLLEPLIGTTLNTTPTQVKNAIEAGRPVAITYTDPTYGAIVFTTFNVGSLGLTAALEICLHISQTVSKKILVILGGELTNDTWEFHPPTYMATEDEIPSIEPNPATTTGTLTGLEIDGVGYAIQGGSGNAWLNEGGTNLNPSSTNPVDLNDLTTAGTYYCGDASVAQYVSNKPTNDDKRFTVVVQNIGGNGNSNIRQIYYQADYVPRMYYRSKNGTSAAWNTWQSEVLTSDMPVTWQLRDGTAIVATAENPVDLDTYLTAGTYYCNDDSSVAYISHKPAAYTQNKRFSLIVQLIGNIGGCVRQIFISGNDNKVYWRFHRGTTWYTDWEEMAYADKMWRLADGVALQATAENHIDLNDLVNAGTYYISSDTADRYDNKPVNNTSRFTLIVQAVGNADANRVKQIYMYIGAHAIYERHKNGSTANWSAWKKIAFADDFATVATTGAYGDLTGAPSLATVATSGSYNDLDDLPTIPAAQVNADWNASSGVAQILNKPTIPAAQVNSDWNANSGVAQILNKPTNATASAGGFMSSTDFKKINAQSIAANTDLNTITNIGWYYTAQGSTLTNAPQTGNYAAMLVYYSGASSRRVQVFFNGSSYTNVYTRLQTSSIAWTPWERIAFASDLPTKLSDLTDDVVSGNYVKLSANGNQVIENTKTSEYVSTTFKSNHSNNECVVGFKNAANTTLGYLGVNASKKPIFTDTSDHELAQLSDVIQKSTDALQVLARTDTGSSTVFAIKSALMNCFMEFIDGNNAGLGYFGVMASKTPVYVPFGSSMRGQISVVGRNAAHAYTTTSGSSYAKIKINSTAAWMLSFRVRVYSGYTTDEYIIGGYNYASTKRWYSPTAILVNSNGTTRKVIFGYDGDNDLWVAVPVGAYRACDIIDVVNASTQLDTSDLFTITWVAEADLSTVQVETTVSPLAKKSDIGSVGTLNLDGNASHYLAGDGTWKNGTADPTKLPLAGGQMTGAITWAQGSISQQNANTMPYFLGIDAFASGGATKWQSAAGVANALNAAGLVKKTTNIQSGSASITAGTQKQITFPTAFGGAPNVVVTHEGSNIGYASVFTITASSFYVKSSIGGNIRWIAYYNG